MRLGERRGSHGDRRRPPVVLYDLREVADVLHEAVDAAGARRPVLVGHSGRA
jgi:pimeloyl-ACP methyl ester carboxylesterase